MKTGLSSKSNKFKKGGSEPALLSDSDVVPSDLLSQPFCWLMLSHWTTNSVNCRRASHTKEKQGTAVLNDLPHWNLDVCNCSRLTHQAYRVICASLGQNERAHREIGRNLYEKHPPSGQFNAGRTNRTLYYMTVLITWTGTCSGQRLMTT